MTDSIQSQESQNITRRTAFIQGARDTIPMMVGAAPFGVIFGVLGIAAGMTSGTVLGFSMIVFAGSAQFIAAKLLADGLSIALIVLTTFIVNLRHALYSASLGLHLSKLPQRWLLPLAFWLTDETYAVVITHWEKDVPHKRWYHLGSSVSMYVNWQLWTILGLIAGTQLEGVADLGLEFAMVVTFIGIVVPLVKTRPMLLSALVAGIVSILAAPVPNNGGLMIASLAGIVAGIIAEAYLNKDKRYEIETS